MRSTTRLSGAFAEFCEDRYWFDATYYKPGGPVFLLDGGETDGAGRLPFLKEGILQILAEATGGIGCVEFKVVELG